MDAIGGLLGVADLATTASGHASLLDWLRGFGRLTRVGIEGTSSYWAGLAGYLRSAGVDVVEVDRPNRQSRRGTGKSDPLDLSGGSRRQLHVRCRGAGPVRH